MVSHVSLLVVIISVKNNQSCLTGVAKYKIAEGLTQSIKFKYFFPTDYPSQTFATGDIVYILGKYIVENSEPCFTVAYSSIVDSGNPNWEFDMSDVPVTIPYCTYFVTVNHAPKNVGELIHFGVETVQYNPVTGNSEVKMDITVIYPHQSVRFKYLGSNIKLRSNYFVSGLLRFSKSGKIMIEATDIDYLKTSTIGISASKRLTQQRRMHLDRPMTKKIITPPLKFIRVKKNNLITKIFMRSIMKRLWI
ncbi:hypothetical protein C2G38_2102729 [Gigaspora rosea]|uniref:Uncharacterized protein n=1 Tax=Gigaspora rosea TaxID=44941 RepID=A0A397URE2_9GLOM|nr:hypothetical protein C2G38_2102729 [Gigaspora rosea]